MSQTKAQLIASPFVQGNLEFTFPTAHGNSGNVLQTDGTGTLTFASPVPPGTIIHVCLTSAPSGYIKANGATISRTTYAALFSAIGTTFGVGDGSTTFTLPDLRGEFLRAWDDGRGVDSGRSANTAQSDAFASHGHDIRGGSGDIPDWFGGSNAAYGMLTAGGSAYSGYVQNVGGTETRPRNIALLACIKF